MNLRRSVSALIVFNTVYYIYVFFKKTVLMPLLSSGLAVIHSPKLVETENQLYVIEQNSIH
jgi:hypothetical protein